MFSVAEHHVRFGLDLIEKKEISNVFIEDMKTQAEKFYEEFCWLNYQNAKLISPPHTPEFEREMVRFFNATYFLVGVLYAAYGKKFPNIDQKLIDDVIKEGQKLASSPQPLPVRIKERLEKLNPAWIETFERCTKDLYDIGKIYVYTLAEIFLRQVEKEDQSLVDEVDSFFKREEKNNQGD